jgi:hypothetical protein
MLIEKLMHMSRKFNSIGRTLHYICEGSGFESWSSHLSTSKVKFLTTGLVNQKKKTNTSDLQL